MSTQIYDYDLLIGQKKLYTLSEDQKKRIIKMEGELNGLTYKEAESILVYLLEQIKIICVMPTKPV
jgi:hypothetical protein